MSASYEDERAKYNKCFKATATGELYGAEEEMRMSPLITSKVRDTIDTLPKRSAPIFPQARLLGRTIEARTGIEETEEPLLYNGNAPNSTFLCGSQGSGKSYTLSTILENCLVKDGRYGDLKNPVAGVLFHYDTDMSGTPAEAASLCSRGVKVRVLVSPSNYCNLSKTYKSLPGGQQNLTVEQMLLDDRHLDIARMKRLMAFSDAEAGVPLYMEVIEQILREMAMSQAPFRFSEFERRKDLKERNFDPKQKNMLNMRLNLLKSFMANAGMGTDSDVFQPAPGTLTIVDLTDPFVDAATVCMLYDVCLSLFKQRRPKSGLVMALDEAHRYLNKSPAAATFTDSLISTIRTQRHNATRVIIATQEPTISERLLDLCSISIVHHFNSPAWFAAIKDHLGGASSLTTDEREQRKMFEAIVDLGLGESLVFSPSSFVCEVDGVVKKLGAGYVKMQTRLREGLDAGKSEMAIS